MLAPEQQALLVAAFPHGPRPSGDQTAEQATEFAVVGVQHICALEGLAVPGEADVRIALHETTQP